MLTTGIAGIGTAKRVIDDIIQQRSKGNPILATATRTKLLLKGINPNTFTMETPDDPTVMNKLRSICRELGVRSIYLNLN
jgi:hypothetical protein